MQTRFETTPGDSANYYQTIRREWNPPPWARQSTSPSSAVRHMTNAYSYNSSHVVLRQECKGKNSLARDWATDRLNGCRGAGPRKDGPSWLRRALKGENLLTRCLSEHGNGRGVWARMSDMVSQCKKRFGLRQIQGQKTYNTENPSKRRYTCLQPPPSPHKTDQGPWHSQTQRSGHWSP